MIKFYIGFGFSHPLAKFILCIEANNENEAREAASACFPKWASISTHIPKDWVGNDPENGKRMLIGSHVDAATALREHRQ